MSDFTLTIIGGGMFFLAAAIGWASWRADQRWHDRRDDELFWWRRAEEERLKNVWRK